MILNLKIRPDTPKMSSGTTVASRAVLHEPTFLATRESRFLKAQPLPLPPILAGCNFGYEARWRSRPRFIAFLGAANFAQGGEHKFEASVVRKSGGGRG
jgi:hypothetical protein